MTPRPRDQKATTMKFLAQERLSPAGRRNHLLILAIFDCYHAGVELGPVEFEKGVMGHAVQGDSVSVDRGDQRAVVRCDAQRKPRRCGVWKLLCIRAGSVVTDHLPISRSRRVAAELIDDLLVKSLCLRGFELFSRLAGRDIGAPLEEQMHGAALSNV
jgi:hypothetical protein